MPPFCFVVLDKQKPWNGLFPVQGVPPNVYKTRFRKTRDQKLGMTVLTKASSRLSYQTREALDRTGLSCRTRIRVKPKYSKKNLTECHFMPTSFQCSNRLLDIWDRQDGIHYVCEWTWFIGLSWCDLISVFCDSSLSAGVWIHVAVILFDNTISNWISQES
jgi:hypothetical protein